MKKMTLAAMLIGAVALSACSQDRFNAADAANSAGANAGGVNDPTSAAYFNQAIGDRVIFAVDQSTLSPEAEAVLAQQAQWLSTNQAYSAIIEGHADEQGTREYNVALGARRATAEQSYLIERGVAPNPRKTVSYGKERPLAICSDESCYAQNRRAVTVLTTGAGT